MSVTPQVVSPVPSAPAGHHASREDGTKKDEFEYVPVGAPDGHHVSFREDGTKSDEFDHKDGKHHGPYIGYRPDGTIHFTCTFIDGKPDGLHQQWDHCGRLCHETEFKEGNVVSTRAFTYGGSGRFEVVTVNPTAPSPPLKRFTYWYSNGILGEERDLDVANKVLRVLTLRDATGRDCLLGEGELTVWKIAKTVISPVDETFEETEIGEPVYSLLYDEECVVLKSITTVRRVKTPWVYVRLTVPADAKRVTPMDSSFQYKSRVEFARVEEIVDREGNHYDVAYSAVNGMQKRSVYKVGEIVRPDEFNDDPSHECGAGISVHVHRDHCDTWIRA